MNNDVAIIGMGGHASVALDVAQLQGFNCIGYVDTLESKRADIGSLPYLGNDNEFIKKNLNIQISLINGIATIKSCELHKKIYQFYNDRSYQFTTLVHPSAVISQTAYIGKGVQVFANAVIQANTKLNENIIINTGSIIEHDVSIGAHSHIAPGAVICGFVKIGSEVFIGANATVLPGVKVTNRVIIGAGSVVLEDITVPGTYFGNPARPYKILSEVVV